MKRFPYPDDPRDPDSIKWADWKASAESVLETVDEQLAEHGLEVVLYGTGSDEYAWIIQKR